MTFCAQAEESFFQPPQYTGKERDAESGLDWFETRYYGSALGRFASPDQPFAGQHVEDPQSWNMYSYVRNNPLRYTDPDGRDCTNGVSSCLNYIAGGLMAIGNIPSEALNAPNHIANALISPFTDYRFSDLVSPTLTPSNVDQQQGMNAANAVMLVSPVAEAGATAAVEALGTATRVETATEAVQTGVQANKAVGDAFRDEVAAGLAQEGRGVQTEVTKTTPFGRRSIDIEVSDKPGGKVLGGIETKTGNSPYKPSQRAKDEYLKRQGYPVNVVRKKPEDK
jgi:RHS repeat-associated protein